MKKLIGVMIILVLCGCSVKQEEYACTYENTDKYNRYTTNVRIKIKNDVVEDATVVITYKDKTLADNMCDIYKGANESDAVECKDEVITLNRFHKSISTDDISLDEVLEYFGDRNYTCNEVK